MNLIDFNPAAAILAILSIVVVSTYRAGLLIAPRAGPIDVILAVRRCLPPRVIWAQSVILMPFRPLVRLGDQDETRNTLDSTDPPWRLGAH